MSAADLPISEKKKMMLGLILGNYLSASLSTVMVAFYADFCNNKFGKDVIDSTKVGLVLGMLEGAGLLASPFFKSLLQCMGRKNAIIYGHVFMFIANTSLACVAFIPAE